MTLQAFCFAALGIGLAIVFLGAVIEWLNERRLSDGKRIRDLVAENARLRAEVRRDIEEGEGERKGSAARAGGGSGETGRGRCYRIGSFDSHGMRSANPHAGIYRTEAANALNAFDSNPNKGQGGIAILQGCDIYNGVVTGESAVSLTTAPANGTDPRVLSFQERAGRPGGGKGILVQPEHTGALSTVNNQRVLSGGLVHRDRTERHLDPHHEGGFADAEHAEREATDL